MCRASGLPVVYLHASEAGRPLYESLGFTTRVVTKVWAWGESHQV